MGSLGEGQEHGEYARPAVFIVGTDHKVVHAWTDGLPAVEEIQAKVTEITGLPKPPEEEEEKPQEATEGGEKPKKMSAEERERIKAERRAAREAGKSIKTPSRNSRPKASRHPRRCPRRSGAHKGGTQSCSGGRQVGEDGAGSCDRRSARGAEEDAQGGTREDQSRTAGGPGGWTVAEETGGWGPGGGSAGRE